MYQLMAVSHEGLTLESIAAIPVVETRQPLLEWVDAGARSPVRIAMHADSNVLRQIQQSLAFHGVRTEIRQMQASPSGGFGAEPGAEQVPPPPTRDSFVSAPGETQQDSGLLQYRQMVAEMDARRSSATHVLKSSVEGFRPAHLIPIIILAILGLIFAIASRGN